MCTVWLNVFCLNTYIKQCQCHQSCSRSFLCFHLSFFNYLFCLYYAIFYYAGDDIPISPPRINKVSVYPGSRLSATVRSCQLRSTLLFRSTWTSPSWWRATSLTCASTSLLLPATHFAFFSTRTAWFAWAQRSTMHPVKPTWWVTDNNTTNNNDFDSLY